MGYIVGRNSAPGARWRQRKAAKAHSAWKRNAARAIARTRITPRRARRTTTRQPEQPRQHDGTPETAPSANPPAPVKERSRKPEPSPAAKNTKAGGRAESVFRPGGPPPAGRYWQVVATARPDAEIIAEALTKKAFTRHVVPAPREGVFQSGCWTAGGCFDTGRRPAPAWKPPGSRIAHAKILIPGGLRRAGPN